MRQELCLCAEIAQCRALMQIRTRVVVLMHHRERFLTTNTARLAALTLPGSEIRIRGLQSKPFDPSGILEDTRQPLLLYPSEEAVPLSPEYVRGLGRDVTLIVPDGSWRQASKVAKREPFLKDVPHVTLPEDKISSYQLRREPKESGLATFEAIARALRFLESPGIRASLEGLFNLMVNRTMDSRRGIFPTGQIPGPRNPLPESK